MRHPRFPRRLTILAMTLLAMALSSIAPAVAGPPWAWAIQVLDARDQATVHPVIQDMLANDPVGTRREWHSPSGKNGYVYLDSGGEQAGSSEASVRITRETNGAEARLFVFRYRKDPKMGWGVIG